MIHPHEDDRYRYVIATVPCLAGERKRYGTLRHWSDGIAMIRDHDGRWFNVPLADCEWEPVAVEAVRQ